MPNTGTEAGDETELRMRIYLNFTEAIMATEEDAFITDLAGKLSQTSMSPLPLRSIILLSMEIGYQ